MAFFENLFKPTKAILGAPKGVKNASVKIGSVIKDVTYDGPKWLHNKTFSKKGLLAVAGIVGAIAAAKGIANWSNSNKIEESQIAEATDLRASIEANKAARVETSMAMGESGTIPYRNDWRNREKGGLPNLPPTV